MDPLTQVRSSDLEPYTGLGYLSKLFRLIAVLLLVVLVAEVGIGVYQDGSYALRTLLTEASRMVVVAGVLWGAGDLATLLIDVGHDVRATRILLGRQVAHQEMGHLDGGQPTTGADSGERAGADALAALAGHPAPSAMAGGVLATGRAHAADSVVPPQGPPSDGVRRER
jgi:hypothetical protein